MATINTAEQFAQWKPDVFGLAGLPALRAMLDQAFKDFRRNPSAEHYLALEHAMLVYQDRIKNQERSA
jgi:hypothetical protein